MHTTTRATSRTWATATTYRECGVVTGQAVQSVTLTRTPGGLEATVNGEACELRRAVSILQGATRTTVTAETLEPAPIGKARACDLHKLMARAGVPSGEHYGLAGAALDRPVFSLATLTETDARAVWHFLQATHPHARAFAA